VRFVRGNRISITSQLLTFDVPIRGTFSEKQWKEKQKKKRKNRNGDDANVSESYEHTFSLSFQVLKRDNLPRRGYGVLYNRNMLNDFTLDKRLT